jgi:hypothetical protein
MSCTGIVAGEDDERREGGRRRGIEREGERERERERFK